MQSCLHKNPQPREKSKNTHPTTNTLTAAAFPARVVIRNDLFIQQQLLYQTDLARISISKRKSCYTVLNSPQTTIGKNSELRFLQRVNSRKALSDFFQVIRRLTKDQSPQWQAEPTLPL